jgi:nucleoside-diphosphate-sugar epimerase
MTEAKNILLLGSSGWIGRQLVQKLMDTSHHRVTCWVRSTFAAEQLSQYEGHDRLTVYVSDDLTKFTSTSDTDVVIHAASPTNHWDLKGSIDTNIGLTLRLIESMSGRSPPPRLIYLSSLLLRGNSQRAFSENDLEAGQLFLTPYAQMKFLGEMALITSYIKDVECIRVRIGSVLWPKKGHELPSHHWFCQAVNLWTRGFLNVLPLPPNHIFFPVAVDDLCTWLVRIATEKQVPSVLHLPEIPGPNLQSVFEVLAKETKLPPPIFCNSDSDLWPEYLSQLQPGTLKRRLANLFPIPPKGAMLSAVNSEETANWLRRLNLQSVPSTDDYWLAALKET